MQSPLDSYATNTAKDSFFNITNPCLIDPSQNVMGKFLIKKKWLSTNASQAFHENLASESDLQSHSKAESGCLERKGVLRTW